MLRISLLLVSSSRVFHRVLVVWCLALLLFSTGNVFAQETLGKQPIEPNLKEAIVDAMPASIQDYVIAPDDLLDIYILDVPELSRAYRVGGSGELVFPLLAKPMLAAGRTLDEFASLLTKELKSSGTISNPYVTVTVKESRTHSVSISGAVRNPQIYPIMGPAKLLSVLSQAGGIGDDAGNVVIIARGGLVYRTSDNPGGNAEAVPASALPTITINLNELLSFQNPNLNVDVYPGDWITVPPAGVIYVVGAVNRPGGFVLNTSHEHLTVLQALALASDVKSTAQREHSMIIRRNPHRDGERQEIAINLKKVLSGKSPDISLEPNDIFFIPDSAAKKALHRGAEAAIQIATGAALFHL
jgi:polysaccharide biosynthesis/export protein